MRVLAQVVIAGILAAGGVAHAEGHYCLKGTADQRPGPGGPDVSAIYKECAIGDTVALMPGLTALAPQICDFSKAILSAPSGVTFCVLGPLRPMKK